MQGKQTLFGYILFANENDFVRNLENQNNLHRLGHATWDAVIFPTNDSYEESNKPARVYALALSTESR